MKLEKQIKDKKKQIDNLVNKLALDDSISDILIDKIKSLKDEVQSYESELLKISNNIEAIKEDTYKYYFISRMLDRCENIRELSNDEQKRVINAFIDVITYNSDTDLVDISFIGANSKKK